MFAFLALAGDLGGILGPLSVGFAADRAGGDLKMGFLLAAAFPAALVLGLTALREKDRQTSPES